jgi:hypothetical protein
MGLARRKSELWAEQRPKELEFMFTERRRPVGETHDESCQAARATAPTRLSWFIVLPTLPQSTFAIRIACQRANRPYVVGQFPLLGANSTKSQVHQFQRVHQISPGEFSFVPTSPTGWRVQQIYSWFKRVTGALGFAARAPAF